MAARPSPSSDGRPDGVAHATRNRLNGWGLAASALLHVCLCLFALLLPAPSPMPPPPTSKSIDVEIVALPPAVREDRQPAPPRIPSPEAPEARTAPKEAPSPDEPAMVKPSRMLSEKALADPRSRKARKELAALAPADQVEQLCGLEAMAQVGAWSSKLRPDRVVAYAMADPEMKGNEFSADGAALHSRHDWYRLRFKCELTSDHKKIAAFQFMVGDPIPRKDWAAHNLPDEDKSLD